MNTATLKRIHHRYERSRRQQRANGLITVDTMAYHCDQCGAEPYTLCYPRCAYSTAHGYPTRDPQ